MLAKAILVHGVIGYKFCWLLPEDQNQRAPAGHESVETPIGNESNGAVAGDGATSHWYNLSKTLVIFITSSVIFLFFY